MAARPRRQFGLHARAARNSGFSGGEDESFQGASCSDRRRRRNRSRRCDRGRCRVHVQVRRGGDHSHRRHQFVHASAGTHDSVPARGNSRDRGDQWRWRCAPAASSSSVSHDDQGKPGDGRSRWPSGCSTATRWVLISGSLFSHVGLALTAYAKQTQRLYIAADARWPTRWSGLKATATPSGCGLRPTCRRQCSPPRRRKTRTPSVGQPSRPTTPTARMPWQRSRGC